MRLLVAIALAVALLASPLECVAAGCDLTKAVHDCCPRSRAATPCPYDLLAAAKTPRAPAALWLDGALSPSPAIAFAARQFAPEPIASLVADGRDLHTRIRVLLI
jgi:hypothetical protein